MSPTRNPRRALVITMWTGAGDAPSKRRIRIEDDGGWTDLNTGPVAPDELLRVPPAGALMIDTGGLILPRDIAAHLPTGEGYAGFTSELVTGHAAIDSLGFEDAGTRVVIDGDPWALLTGPDDEPMWFGLDPHQWQPVPRAKIVASAGASETASMTSGWDAWSLGLIDDHHAVHLSNLDEAPLEFEVVRRTDDDLDRLLGDWIGRIEWEPVAAAAARALAVGESMSMVGSDLDEEWSSTLEISVVLDLPS